tara:strand:+ start:162 stop:350 length:189 start_codon:yes stop_codon:yes gene_type:complete
MCKCLEEKIDKMIEALEEAKKDAEKCEKGNASAGRRLRKVALQVSKECKVLRADVMSHLKGE